MWKYSFLILFNFVFLSCSRRDCKLDPYVDAPSNTNEFEPCTAHFLIEGNYQGKNVYVQNPFVDSAFCSCAVEVNGVSYPGDIQASAYEIDLSTFKMGDSVKIQITHHPNCRPKVIGPVVH